MGDQSPELIEKAKKITVTLQELRPGSQALSRSSSNISDGDLPRRKAEPAYSFVGMHCIFDQCKAMGNSFENLNYNFSLPNPTPPKKKIIKKKKIKSFHSLH